MNKPIMKTGINNPVKSFVKSDRLSVNAERINQIRLRCWCQSTNIESEHKANAKAGNPTIFETLNVR